MTSCNNPIMCLGCIRLWLLLAVVLLTSKYYPNCCMIDYYGGIHGLYLYVALHTGDYLLFRTHPRLNISCPSIIKCSLHLVTEWIRAQTMAVKEQPIITILHFTDIDNKSFKFWWPCFLYKPIKWIITSYYSIVSFLSLFCTIHVCDGYGQLAHFAVQIKWKALNWVQTLAPGKSFGGNLGLTNDSSHSPYFYSYNNDLYKLCEKD